MLRFFGLVAIGLLLTACGSNDEKALATKPAELVKFKASTKLKKRWSVGTGSGQDVKYSRFVPAFENDAIYAADADGDVYAYSQEKHKRIWKVDTKLSVGGAISADANNIYFGTYNGEVVALSAENGERKWLVQVSSEVLAPPASNGSVVVAQTIDGRVFAIDAEAGEIVWSYDHTVPVLSLRGTASPVVVANQVIVAFDNGQILSLGLADGVVQWDVRVSRPQGRTELERIVDVDGTPIVDGAFIYAASYQGNVVAINRGTGRVMWTKNVSTANRISLGGGNVYVSDMTGKVLALNALTGDMVWENFQLKNRAPRAPTVIGDYVAVIEAEDDYMHLLKQSDGTFAYRFKPSGDEFRSPPTSIDGVLYVLADNGKLSAYTIAE